ncbi:MAG: four helix bundle protein [Paludibacteraceae bacterium]|nr:four helix bundle protein [Paludibacteraceae bacterium]MBR4564399.1 four helix bundle protein [Paludibacteraceae bacterium]
MIRAKSMDFAVRIVKFYKYLCDEKKEFVMSKQILRSGTSIGANVSESKNAQTTPDYLTKMNIALKEADETLYWVELLFRSEYITKDEYQSLCDDLKEIIAILVSIVKKLKEKGK